MRPCSADTKRQLCARFRHPAKEVTQPILAPHRAVMEPGADSDISSCDPTVGEVMSTDMLVFSTSMSVRDACQALLNKRVSGAPVVDDNNVLVGVFSESDVLCVGC